LGVEGALPQQHGELARARRVTRITGLTCADAIGEVANLEHRGEHFVPGVTMGHVFDPKSKTSI
jgi:hypothetical protein